MMNFNGISRGQSQTPALTLGFDLDLLQQGIRSKIIFSLSRSNATSALIIGSSGSGKSYFLNSLFAKLTIEEPHGEVIFADFKGEFEWLQGCPRYFAYKNAYSAIDLAYSKLCTRLSGDDSSENPVTLIFDEYVSAVLSQQAEDKKQAAQSMSRIAEILLMGRACGRASVRFWCFTQRPDASVFSTGSRDQFGTIVALGNISKETKQMLFSDFSEDFEEGKEFQKGEGRVVFNNSNLYHIKVPRINDMNKVKRLCKKALSKPL